MMRKPRTLSANARFNTNPRKVVASDQGVPEISSSLKKAIKCGSNAIVTRVVSKNV